MGFSEYVFGLNEPTLTSAAYVCYLAAFVFYSAYLISLSSRALRVPQREFAPRMALAGAAGAAGGTADMNIDMLDERPRVTYAPALGRLAVGLVMLAWVCMTIAIGQRWVESGHYPVVTLYEIATMLVWGTTTIYLVLFETILKTRALGAFVILLIFCLQSYALWFIPGELKQTIQLVPALRSYWLIIHVSIAILAYSAFAVAAGAGLTFVAKHYFRSRIAGALPSEAAIEEFMFRAVAVGFPLQTLLLITGAIWAQEAWTKAWSWDPKETWALITWLTYAAYLHVRVQRGVRGITMAWLSLIGFVVVLFTFMGVNYLVQWFGMTSKHTYSTDNGAPAGLNVAGLLMVFSLVALLAVALFGWLKVRFPGSKSRHTAE